MPAEHALGHEAIVEPSQDMPDQTPRMAPPIQKVDPRSERREGFSIVQLPREAGKLHLLLLLLPVQVHERVPAEHALGGGFGFHIF